MTLVKKSENVQRTYKEDGSYVDVVISITYEVKNADGNVVGNANVNTNNVNLNQYNFANIDEARAYLESLFAEVAE